MFLEFSLKIQLFRVYSIYRILNDNHWYGPAAYGKGLDVTGYIGPHVNHPYHAHKTMTEPKLEQQQTPTALVVLPKKSPPRVQSHHEKKGSTLMAVGWCCSIKSS
jgi:hypothetical protein